MAHTLLKRVIGESYDDPVTHHLDTVGAGIPPAGRSYPELKPSRFLPNGGEETREVQIGKEMLAAIKLLPPMVQKDVSMRRLSELANELILMHSAR